MSDPRGQLYLNFLSVDTFLQASIGADRTQRRAATRDHEAAAGRIRPARCYLVIPCIEIHYTATLKMAAWSTLWTGMTIWHRAPTGANH
eukprot:scaffold1386_cov119-Isochrysis_galbana.AAC.3